MKHTVRESPWFGVEWRVIEVYPKSAASLIRRLDRYPENVIVLVDDLPEGWKPPLIEGGLKIQYSILDLAWVVVGPKQMDRVNRLRQLSKV